MVVELCGPRTLCRSLPRKPLNEMLLQVQQRLDLLKSFLSILLFLGLERESSVQALGNLVQISKLPSLFLLVPFLVQHEFLRHRFDAVFVCKKWVAKLTVHNVYGCQKLSLLLLLSLISRSICALRTIHASSSASTIFI